MGSLQRDASDVLRDTGGGLETAEGWAEDDEGWVEGGGGTGVEEGAAAACVASGFRAGGGLIRLGRSTVSSLER